MKRNRPLKNSMRYLLVMLALLTAFGVSAKGTEVSMSGRLILQDGNQGWEENTPAPNSKIKNGYTIGVAIFEDNTIAEKQYVFSQNNRENDGNILGFSVYTFPDGDTLLMEFEAAWTEEGLSGTYLGVVAGTGRFSGASGGGTFTGVAGPWYETILTDFTMNLLLVD